MRLWLIRHGECEADAASDTERALTPDGVRDVEKVAGRLFGRYPDPPQALFCSPLHRAWQTAEIFNSVWGLPLQTVEFLLPLVEPSRVFEALRARPEPMLALVGHLPNLGLLLATLLQGLPPREAPFPRAGAALLEVAAWDPGKGRLLEFFKPEEIP